MQAAQTKSPLFKLTVRIILPLAILLLGSVDGARAQGLSVSFGFGSARDSVGTSVIEGCPTGLLFDGVVCETGQRMGGLFGTAGVGFMFKRHLGVEGEYSFRFSQAPFLAGNGLNIRPTFYDLNALWQPFSSERAVPYLEGGFGGAQMKLYSTEANPITGVTTRTGYIAGSNTNHFALHGAFGLKLYVHGNLFVKPQFDLRYVTHLTDQFGRNVVMQYSGSVGYTFGQR